jgi:hypothetical protein
MVKPNKRLARTNRGHIALVGRQPVQCKCVWCDKAFMSDIECLNDMQREFILDYARTNGRSWKKKLGDEWFCAKGCQVSISIRNSFGPTWLANLSLAKIKEVDDAIALRERLVKKMGT